MQMEQESDDSDDVISALNVIPFIDICLVLLIIVLVTASFTVALIGFDLPQGAKTEYVEAKSAVTVDVGPDGRCTIGGKVVAAGQGRASIEKLRSQDGTFPALIVRAGPDVKSRQVVAAVDQIHAAGNIHLVFSVIQNR